MASAVGADTLHTGLVVTGLASTVEHSQIVDECSDMTRVG